MGTCRARDVKGLYSRAQAGQIPQMTGLSSAFENPLHPDLVVNTADENANASSAALIRFATARLGLKAS